MKKSKSVNGWSAWTPRDERTLTSCARKKLRVADIAKQLGRTRAAVQQKAMRMGLSFR
jgi:hypothetical protein